MTSPERKWFLFSRNISGEATPAEQAELKELLDQHPDLAKQYAHFEQFWKAKFKSEETDDTARISRILQLSEVEEALSSENEQPVHRISRKRTFLKTAAVLAGLLLCVWVINKTVNKTPSSKPGVIVSQKGTKTRIILPDGSTVWLNAGSRIEYDPAFKGKQREITLFGEAYFDVVKIPDMPFLVHAGKYTIKVLGTAFNVKSYPGEGPMETTLIRGLVQITRDDNNTQPPIFLHPNQKIVLSEIDFVNSVEGNTKKFPEFQVALLDSNLKENEFIETAWVYNRLEFRGDNFEDLARKLERWYNINIHFEDEEAKQLMFNGSIENETVEQAFEALRTAVPFEFKIKDNEVYIASRLATN